MALEDFDGENCRDLVTRDVGEGGCWDRSLPERRAVATSSCEVQESTIPVFWVLEESGRCLEPPALCPEQV